MLTCTIYEIYLWVKFGAVCPQASQNFPCKYFTNLLLELVLLHDLLARLHEARTPLVQLNKEKE